MSQTLIPVQPEPPAPARAAGVYTGPDDVVGDRNLTTAEKRAILASWVSDARAVEDAPSLRRLDSGAVVEVETVLEALRLLDRSPPSRGDAPKWPPPSGRRRSVVARLLSRAGPRSRSDDDDDPPTAPATFGIPFRPAFVMAYGGQHAAAAAGGRG
jgi:hypothetical protein